MFRWVRSWADSFTRSPKWRSVRQEYLRENPACAACGATEGVDVHHVRPVWKYPADELSPDNLIGLCGPPRNCHWALGHGFNWKDYRPGVRELAAKMLESPVIRHK